MQINLRLIVDDRDLTLAPKQALVALYEIGSATTGQINLERASNQQHQNTPYFYLPNLLGLEFFEQRAVGALKGQRQGNVFIETFRGSRV